jgi:hypothetical protein
MRFTFVILLFCCLGADAQMIIKAHANYRPYAVAVAQNLLLDDYPNSLYAYSLRKLDNDYTGAAIRVRKDTTGQPEQDINFIGNELDTASLKMFLNARSGFVTTWYDQSGNSRNATMTVQANQPRIANLGVIERRQGKVSIFFDGSNDYLLNTTIGYTVNLTQHYAVSSRGASVASTQTVYSTGILSGLTNGFGFAYRPNNIATPNTLVQQARNLNTTIVTLGSYANTINVSNMIFGVTSATADSTYFNGGDLQTAAHTRANVITNSALMIGARSDGATNNPGVYLNGTVSEIIRWATINAPNRNEVFTNVNSYYSIW